MSTAAHTPGPWAIKEYNNGHTGEHGLHGIFQEREEGQQYTPIVEKVWGASLEESDANARLIAASPEMAEALRDLVSEYENNAGPIEPGDIPAMDNARALLAKIEGES